MSPAAALLVTEVETMSQYRKMNSRIYCSVRQIVLLLLHCAVNGFGNCKYNWVICLTEHELLIALGRCYCPVSFPGWCIVVHIYSRGIFILLYLNSLWTFPHAHTDTLCKIEMEL